MQAAHLDDIANEMALRGLDDLVVLVVNKNGQIDYITELEMYVLPVLQDTAEDDVFGTWGVRDYDTFIIDRAGDFAFGWWGIRPIQDQSILEEALGTFL